MVTTRDRSLKIGIAGAGRLGTALALGLEAAGYRLTGVAGPRTGSAEALAARLSGAQPLPAPALAELCDLIFLTVPDGDIATTAASIPWRPGQAAVHCSGALGLEALESAAAAGARIGSFHPLQSFPSPAGDASRFHGIVCGVEGAEPLGGRLERMAVALGATPVRLEGVDRALYHAAAVFASNYVVALAAAARRVWTMAGLPLESAQPALAPLLSGAAQSAETLALQHALTGPIARGDVDTVERHLAALASDSALRELYRRLGAQLLDLPLNFAPESQARLRDLLAADDVSGGSPR